MLTRLSSQANLSGAIPGDIAGRPVYSLRVSPSHDGGLLGAVQLAWDAEHGVPLKLAVYSRGDASPVLALTATDVHYGAIPSSDLTVHAPASIKPVDVKLPASRLRQGSGREAPPDQRRCGGGQGAAVQAVRSRLAGRPAAQGRAAGRDRRLACRRGAVRPGPGHAGGVRAAGRHQHVRASDPLAALPAISINGARGHELATALGTVIRVTSGGVTYTLVGSVPAVAAEAAARAVS